MKLVTEILLLVEVYSQEIILHHPILLASPTLPETLLLPCHLALGHSSRESLVEWRWVSYAAHLLGEVFVAADLSLLAGKFNPSTALDLEIQSQLDGWAGL